MKPARPGHCGNTGGGKPTPPTVLSMCHYGAVEVPEWDAPVHIAVQKGSREEVTALGGGGGEGGHLQGIQRLWAPPVDDELPPIPMTGDIGRRQQLAGGGQ